MIDSEKKLLNEVQSGNQEALEILVRKNNGLIWSIVKKFYGSGYDLEDLYQIGSIGFIKAVKRFRQEYGYQLSTFAVPYIMGEIKKFMRDYGMIKVSRNIKKDCKKEDGTRIYKENFWRLLKERVSDSYCAQSTVF